MIIPRLNLRLLAGRPATAYNSGMDYVPRQETIRLLAAASYLPAVPLFLLLNRRYRDVRLIRFHAFQAIGLILLLVLLLIAGSIVSTLLGSLPGLGELINMLVGLGFMIVLLGSAGVAFYGAAQAAQGNYTRIPILTDWVWAQVNGSGRPQPPRKKRARKRPRPEEESWEEPASASEEEAF